MKLRLRSLESKETLKIEVPNSCSLQQLKDTISQTISYSSSSLHLSLNRKDEIRATSPDDPLHSLGVAAGDLVFYSLNPTAFTLETLPHKPETAPRDGPTIHDSPKILAGDAPSIPAAEKSPTLDDVVPETVDMTEGSDEVVVVSNSEPSFMKRVLKEVIGNNITDFKLLVFAVHAVVLESGFVRLDRDSGMSVSCSNLLDDSPISSAISLRYTLPEILTSGGGSHCVNLKFQTLGYFVNVCGSLCGDVGSRLHCVCLDKRKYAEPLELMFAISESEGSVSDGGEEDILFGSEVFEMWKMVKDRLALPLLIDLCEKSGLDLPPCFMRLPMELKLVILERLPGVDLAKVACTCSELRYLSTNNELWKKKYEEEFGQRGGSRGWFFKDFFAVAWEMKKRMAVRPDTISRNMIHPPGRFRIPVWRGGYGVQPVAGVPFPRHPLRPRRFAIPSCLCLIDFNQ